MNEGNKTITLPGGSGNVSWKGSDAEGVMKDAEKEIRTATEE